MALFSHPPLSTSLLSFTHPILSVLCKLADTHKRETQAAKIGKEYEARGGDYENEAGSKNKPEKGPPQKKSEAEKKAESTNAKTAGDGDGEEKPKANEKKKGTGRPKSGEGAPVKKEKKVAREGLRKSSRQAGKSAENGSDGGTDGGVKSGAKRKNAGAGAGDEESAAKKGKTKK